MKSDLDIYVPFALHAIHTFSMTRLHRIITAACLLLRHSVLCDWNSNYGFSCSPAECAEENSCYCTDFYQGWWNGGAVLADYTDRKARCYKGSTDNLCKCNDCWTAGGYLRLKVKEYSYKNS